ncbi:ras-related protein Rap-2a-like [Topomyia yanbarensis]|uniref:ras-related protein Rap-2a-like n=1 Tax=Topomyia yanbarensis TaxID=2498891 RepID=UPI00273BBCA6|nr:ras-related protein Rap-2a-like [Topomyia yanbarensis]XP_058838668.1 ras-related protein Rap-2a-like [Topomyia yanbarensis]XP_058838669.1 ras-related protein Rap-2a-like [Topomyia yanbarensis]XP_058838670.1 ras-related protein Rap-2a-like [Topomyia yanbarensis]XP_058838671.1 ras-related protein Rap-2a-like [Topomyia yanbarensis]XP_058838672.1 ras-related protein Rap-2a-like [Topomyia yanbarensis]XP_058838673.1 ras-related protein Rap-2a-like [Topomyia yanbarensis]XP_058838674.1 ras-relate
MPGTCHRLRVPSLASNKSAKGANECEPVTPKKECHRVTMMGAARVGKSSIISQFLYEKYLSRYKQTIEEMHRGEYELPDGSCLTLDILDTSGSYQFPAMRALSINTSGAFILVYAVDDEETWHEVERLREQIVEARGLFVPIVVVGNKCDVLEEERKISLRAAQAKATLEWGCGYAECSAKNNDGILTVFKQLLRQANIEYNLSPAVRRRRKSLPSYTNQTHKGVNSAKLYLKRHSCSVQ